MSASPVSAASRAGLAQPVMQLTCPDHVAAVVFLSDGSTRGRQHLAGRFDSPGLVPERGQAGGGAQLLTQRALGACQVQRLHERLLCPGHVARDSRAKQAFALKA